MSAVVVCFRPRADRRRSVMNFVGYDYRREREDAEGLEALDDSLVANEGDY